MSQHAEANELSCWMCMQLDPPHVLTGSALKLCCSHPDFAAQRAPVIVFSWMSIPRILRGVLTHQSNWGCSTSLAGILHVANTCCCSTHVPDVSSPSTTNISPFRLRNRVKQVAVEMKNGSQVEIRNFESLGSRDAIFIEKRF